MVTNTELKREILKTNQELSEYENKLDKILSTTNKLFESLNGGQQINSENYVISTVKSNNKSFFWVSNVKAEDAISKKAKRGELFLDLEILDLFRCDNGTFIDLGANIGAFSLAFASAGWRGYAFEAGKTNSNVLKKSIILNDFDIKVIEKVVCDETGKRFFITDGPWGRMSINPISGKKSEELDSTTLDAWYVTENIENIDLIKIDIEGSEVAALRGMKNMLRQFQFPPIFTEVNAFALALQGETPYSYFMQAEELGYNIYEKYDGKLYRYSKDIVPVDFCRDYIFVKDIPSYLKNKVFGRIANNDGRIKNVLERLRNFRKWPRTMEYGHEISVYDYDSYLCLVLKDYPQLVTDEIKELLLQIKLEKKDDPIIQSFLKWI